MSTTSTGNSPFQHWDDRATGSLFPKTSLQSVGGEQILFCRVRYEPGADVPRHSHDETEQLMWVLDGELEMTVGDEQRTLHAGDVVVINRGVEHSLTSPTGCAFLEALSPVPRDHVADPGRDLVLGPDGGSRHVER
jgi:quercetin dioxygenase-like cupin family protein